MKISIALCTYNGSQYLKEQLASIAQQTRLPDELVICDDLSTDNTTEIVNEFIQNVRFPVRFSVNEENIGSTKNFENAIELCDGDIIALSDQDDIWHPDKLKCIEEIFVTTPNTGAVFTDAEVVDENLHSLGYTMWESIGFDKNKQKRFNNGKSIEILLKRNVVTGATMAFRSEYKCLINPIPSMWVHDAWIALHVAFIGNLAMICEPLIKYRQHPKQQIGSGNSSYDLIKIIRRNPFYATKWCGMDSKIFLREAHKNNALLIRLNNSQHSIINERAISYLERKINHFHIRANMPHQRLKRLPVVIRELMCFNYHRYSDGFSSFGIDIFRQNEYK